MVETRGQSPMENHFGGRMYTYSPSAVLIYQTVATYASYPKDFSRSTLAPGVNPALLWENFTWTVFKIQISKQISRISDTENKKLIKRNAHCSNIRNIKNCRYQIWLWRTLCTGVYFIQYYLLLNINLSCGNT